MILTKTDDYNKILLYGDSISKGIVYDNMKKRYKKLKSSFYNIVSSKLKATIDNVSKFGNTVIKASKRLNCDINKYKPNITVMEFGGNDCDFKWAEVAENPNKNHIPRTPPEEFTKLITDFIKLLRDKNIQPVLLNMPPIDPMRYFKWISKGKNEKNILTWLGTENSIYWWHEKYNLSLMEVAETQKVPIIDIRREFFKNKDIREYICDDGIHPNEKGHKLIADSILNYVSINFPQIVCK